MDIWNLNNEFANKCTFGLAQAFLWFPENYASGNELLLQIKVSWQHLHFHSTRMVMSDEGSAPVQDYGSGCE